MSRPAADLTPLDIAFAEVSGPMQFAYRYYAEIGKLLEKMNQGQVEELIKLFDQCRVQDGDIWFAGNGGKTALCAEWVNDLTVALPVKPFRAHSVMERVASLTAASNDYTYTSAIWRILRPMVRVPDLCVFLSGSGDSANIVYAAEAAKKNGITVIGIGRGGTLKDIADYHVLIPALDDGPTEDAIMMLLHIVHAWFLRSDQRSIST
jgi:D-sedoheptulose 7-phosphate isomerase